MAYTGEVADLYVILRAVTKPFTDAMMKAGAEGEAAGTRISSSLGKVSPVLMGIAAGTGIALTASVKFASDFETQYTRLFTAAGASKDAVLANRDAMLALGTTTGFTGTQIAEALYHPVSAGLDLATALQVVKYSAEEARISGASLDDTTFSLSSVMKAFKIDAGHAGDTMALLNAIVGDGDMHFQDFNSSIKNWTPTAAAMGISIQSMGSALALLTDNGNSADEAASRVTMGLVMMATPSKQAATLLEGLGVASSDVAASSDLMQQVLKKTGITQNQLALDLKKPDGIYVALTHLKGALEQAGVSGTEADSTLSKIFGGGRSDKAILTLMQNLDGLKQKYQQIGADSSAKKFQQDWEDAQNTTAVAFDKLKAQVINLGIELGMKLLPIVKEFLGWITSGIQWITKHKEAMIALAGVITGVVVVALASMIDKIVAVGVAAAANPIVDIIAAIAFGAVEIVTHWKQVKQFFEELWQWIVDHKTMVIAILALISPVLVAIGALVFEVIKHWKEIWAFLKQLGSDFVQWGKDVVRFFEHVWDDLKVWFAKAWQGAVDAVKHIWDTMKSVWKETISDLEKIWNETGGKVVHGIAQDWDKVSSAVTKEWDYIVNDLTAIWGSLVTIWDATGGKVISAISDAMDFIDGYIHDHWTAIKDFFAGLWDGIYGVFRTALNLINSLITFVWDNVKTVTRIAWNFISAVISNAWNAIYGIIKGAFEFIEGIFKAAWDVVVGIVKTAWDVITTIINTVLDAIKNVLQIFADLLTGKWGKLWDDVKKLVSQAWNDIWTGIKNILGDIYTTVVGAVKDIWDGFVNGIKTAAIDVGKALWGIFVAIFNFFKDAVTWLYDTGKKIIQGLINGIKDMFSTVVSTVTDLGGKIVSSLGSVFNFGSPSKTMHQYGMWIGQGLANGIKSQKGMVASAFGEMTGSMFDTELSMNASMVGPIRSNAPLPNINVYVQGSVLSNRDLRDVVQTEMLQLGARYSTSYTPYKR